MYKRLRLFLSITFLLLLMSACGGGGGSAPPPEPPHSSNWDEMVWDQDNWS